MGLRPNKAGGERGEFGEIFSEGKILWRQEAPGELMLVITIQHLDGAQVIESSYRPSFRACVRRSRRASRSVEAAHTTSIAKSM